MKMIKLAALITAAAMMSGFTACGDKESSSKNESSSQVSQTVNEPDEDKNAPTDSGDSSTSDNDDDIETTKSPEKASAEKTTATADGYSDAYELAQAYYDAYISHDAEAVYEMFGKDEIDAYTDLIDGNENLNGKSAAEVFRRAAVIRAIGSSMDNIADIMDHYADSYDDEWTVMLSEDSLTDVSEEDLKDFNEELGTDYTSAKECPYVFYTDLTNDESFSGNSSAFVEKDGKWYLSYSNAMGADLLNYLELE